MHLQCSVAVVLWILQVSVTLVVLTLQSIAQLKKVQALELQKHVVEITHINSRIEQWTVKEDAVVKKPI